MFAITFFAGVQLLSIWMMSEYIARIYDANNEYDKAIITYQKALDIAPKGSYSLFVNLHEISCVYRHNKERRG